MLREYKTENTIKAKLFRRGDEDGLWYDEATHDLLDDVRFGIKPEKKPYIETKDSNNPIQFGTYYDYYLVIDEKGYKSLVPTDVFERKFKEVE